MADTGKGSSPGSPRDRRRKSRYYERGSVLALGEDSRHEFKGHRNLSVEELPPWSFHPGTDRRGRKAVSRALNAFLNTGTGGTVYLGVLDDGKVTGLRLSRYQMDHVRVSLNDLMNRYNPPVHKSSYQVEFIPVVEPDKLDAVKRGEEAISGMADGGNELEGRYKGHLLRTSAYCWCDKHTVNLFNRGVLMPVYVIEIQIKPFVPNPSVDRVLLQLHPVYEDEEERCYFRRTASIQAYSHQEVVELTVHQVKSHFEQVIEWLRREERRLHTS